MHNFLCRVIVAIVFSFPLLISAMTFDNRYLPLLKKPLYPRPVACHLVDVQPFFMMADTSWCQAFATSDNTNQTGTFALWGSYDERVVDQALQKTGRTDHSLIRSDILARNMALPWTLDGRVHAAGAVFDYYCQAFRSLGFGGSFMFAQVNTALEMNFTASGLTPSDIRELAQAKGKMSDALGLVEPLFKSAEVGDLDLFFRLHGSTDYRFKIKHLEANATFGLLVPIAAARSINNPVSIPLGGDRHFGFYVDLAAEAELKQDMMIGCEMRFTKRLPRTMLQRVPALTEPAIFGAIVGDFRVEPGLTYSFYPYITLKDLRDGWGFHLGYSLITHDEDDFTDMRTDTSVVPSLVTMTRRSSWANEHVTLGLLYDFVEDRDCPGPQPSFWLTWDYPVNWLVSKRSTRSNAITVIFKVDF